jgi:hypothetical protein
MDTTATVDQAIAHGRIPASARGAWLEAFGRDAQAAARDLAAHAPGRHVARASSGRSALGLKGGGLPAATSLDRAMLLVPGASRRQGG